MNIIKNILSIGIFLNIVIIFYSCCSCPNQIDENIHFVIPEYQNIQDKINGSIAVNYDNSLCGCTKLAMLNNGIFVFESGMQTDADGSPNYKVLDPLYGQKETSLRDKDLISINAEKISYFVLPNECKNDWGIKLGTIGAIIYKNKLKFGIFADNGPNNKIGEGSINLVKELGKNPFNERGQVNSGIDAGVIYIVFKEYRILQEQIDQITLTEKVNTLGDSLLIKYFP